MATFFSPAMLAEDRRRAGWSVEQAARPAAVRIAWGTNVGEDHAASAGQAALREVGGP